MRRPLYCFADACDSWCARPTASLPRDIESWACYHLCALYATLLRNKTISRGHNIIIISNRTIIFDCITSRCRFYFFWRTVATRGLFKTWNDCWLHLGRKNKTYNSSCSHIKLRIMIISLNTIVFRVCPRVLCDCYHWYLHNIIDPPRNYYYHATEIQARITILCWRAKIIEVASL